MVLYVQVYGGAQRSSRSCGGHPLLWNTSLFEEAWVIVCRHPMNWWRSEQLCLFTAGAWTIFVAAEGKCHNIKHLWAYMLFGQIVANLFYLACLLARSPTHNKDRQTEKAGPKLWLSVPLSLTTVALSPMTQTSQRAFLPNLLVMHALPFVPLLPSHAAPIVDKSPVKEEHLTITEEVREEKFSFSVEYLYCIVQLASAAIHIRTALITVKYLEQGSFGSHIAEAAWNVLHSHPAQSLIGWEVVWTSISFAAWMATRPGNPSHPSRYVTMPYILIATPIASIGVTAPYVLQCKGDPSELNDMKEE